MRTRYLSNFSDRAVSGARAHTCERVLAATSPIDERRFVLVPIILITLFLLLFSVRAKASDYVIVVDVSGSMTERVSPKDRRIRVTVVQEALRQYLPALPQPSRLYLIAFSTGIVSEREISLTNSDSLREAMAWVQDLARLAKGNGQTHLWTTLQRGLQVAAAYSSQNPAQPVTVRVLTDGEDNERATTLEKVLAEFPQVDGEHIRGNLVLLGDLELKTRIPLPEGAFVVSSNAQWNDIFPPVIIVIPQQPTVGEEVRIVENTRAVYASYEWFINNQPVGSDKVLSWCFPEPRGYHVTLRVKGLQGTVNSSTAVVTIKSKDAFAVEIASPERAVQPGEPVSLIARTSLPAKRYSWSVNGALLGTQADLLWTPKQEGDFQISLVAWVADGRSATNTRILVVKETSLAASISGPDDAIGGQSIQFAGEATGPYSRVEWGFGDGTSSAELSPKHVFTLPGAEAKDYQVTLKVLSPAGHLVEASPHVIHVRALSRPAVPVAAFRILDASVRVGDRLRLQDESQGYLESWSWHITGESSSTDKNPAILLTSQGKKTITLRVHGPGGDNEVSKEITVRARFEPVRVVVRALEDSGVAPLAVQFTNTSSGDIKAWRWDFGDGQSATEANPRHVFAAATNYTLTVTAFPADEVQSPVREQLIIKTAKPWPIWAKATACAVPLAAIAAVLVWALRCRQQRLLLLPVYYWREQESVCRRVDMTRADDVKDLAPYSPLCLRRIGKTQSLIAEALNGAKFVGADGQESAQQPIGQGSRIVIQPASGPSRAVAIAVSHKPRRPSPADEGVVDNAVTSPGPASSLGESEFSWG